jgi:methylated-DNA-[protein]-cysteine S-methyltransferase
MTRPALPEAIEHYVLFDTAIGTCGIAWSASGVRRLQLPERDRAATEQRLSAGLTLAWRPPAPEQVARTIVALQRYFEGHSIDLSRVALDLSRVSPFHRRVYQAARRIAWGQTTSYGRLAREAGGLGAARAVGQAMARNPVPIIVPCHRVVATGGKAGGFSAYGGVVTKERLLALEGVHLGTKAPRLPLGTQERP